MDLKYYNARSKTLANSHPEYYYKENFAEVFEANFDNAPNAFRDIQIEKDYGERNFYMSYARVDSVINPSTGYKYGDDFKSFVFSPREKMVFIGEMLKWRDSYWLCINTNSYDSVSNGGIFRRCNNMFRWIDSNGNKIAEPCIIDYNIMEAGDYQGKDTTIIGGFEKAWCQKNIRSNQIKSNQRFLFGIPSNPVCYKIYANGVRNFLNSKTEDNNSPSLIEFQIGGNYLNEDTDDFENLIADAYKNQYSIMINQDNIKQILGFKSKLTATITKNNEIVNKPISWKSSDKNICFIDEEGNIELLKEGNCEIIAFMTDNEDVVSKINVEINEIIEDEIYISVSPIDYDYENAILQGDEVLYSCYLYKNSVKQEDAFIFNITTNVNYRNYKFSVVDENHFKVKNINKASEDLIITCKTGNETYEYSIDLKGAW